ncbi:MAG: hypothetical protein EHM28_01075 [Spirochaetaceae bacterium]|nr:MAG: hypothetical protein EHM28_01075 [Spirochaetaceae bacterium]
MKNIIAIFAGVLLIMSVVSCESKYADAVRSMDGQINIMNQFSQAVEKAMDASGIAAAIREFNTNMTRHIPEALRIRGKYPEFADPEKLPEEVTANFEKLSSAAVRFEAAMTKAQNWKDDPGVKAALEDLATLMGMSASAPGQDMRVFSVP